MRTCLSSRPVPKAVLLRGGSLVRGPVKPVVLSITCFRAIISKAVLGPRHYKKKKAVGMNV